MRLGKDGPNSVQVFVPGFHPIIAFRLWWRGWQLLRRMNRDPRFAEEAIAFFKEHEDKGWKVTDLKARDD